MIMYILNFTSAIKEMSVNEIRDLIFGNYYKRIEFSKENSYYSMKHQKKKFFFATKSIEKIPDRRNDKEHYQSFIRMKNTKSVKQLKIITQQPKTCENPNIVDIKSVITEHPNTSHQLSKPIRQAEKVGSNSSLYSDIKKVKIL